MARPRSSRSSEPLPAPLPPETRTVGQLVAETLRLYGRNFVLVLPLGLIVAAANQLALDQSRDTRIGVLAAFAPAFTLAYAAASVLAVGRRAPLRSWGVAFAAGVVVFLPAALLFPWFALAAVAWLGLLGLVVPVAVAEGTTLRQTFPRALALGRADYVHALGSLATLVIIFALTRLALGQLLQSQADNTIRAALFLSDLVISPILFLGAAMLYLDQAARVGSRSRTRRRRDADLSDAHDAHREGRSDAQVEPRSPA